jgi:gamma-glutamyltranspeptidase/glutathione hydrolase
VGQANAFGLVQSERNLPAPGKRPLSSMTPVIVLGGGAEAGPTGEPRPATRVVAVAGGAGGPRIITSTTQVLLNALVFGDPAKDAVSRPRLHHQWAPDVLRLEDRLLESARGPWTPGGPAGLREALAQKGHRVERTPEGAVVQLILRRGDAWEAASDPRKGGRPAGR